MLVTVKTGGHTLWCEWSRGPCTSFKSSWTLTPLFTMLQPHSFTSSNTLNPFHNANFCVRGSFCMDCPSTNTAHTVPCACIKPPLTVSSCEGFILITFLQAGLLIIFSVSASCFLPLAYLWKYVCISILKYYYLFTIHNNYKSWNISFLTAVAMPLLLNTCISRTQPGM